MNQSIKDRLMTVQDEIGQIINDEQASKDARIFAGCALFDLILLWREIKEN